MTPTLLGRIETRIAVLAVIGGLWTLAITPLLPGMGTLSERYRATFAVLVVVIVAGIGWEVIYHLLQQFRWEKDWPTLFGLLTGVPEGVATWYLVQAELTPWRTDVPGSAFVIHFSTTWLVTFLFVNGPMRVPFIRWRFRGGRLV